MAARGENLAHLLAWCIDEQMTVLQLLRKPFYHPTMEEALQGALRDVLSKLDLEKTDVPARTRGADVVPISIQRLMGATVSIKAGNSCRTRSLKKRLSD